MEFPQSYAFVIKHKARTKNKAVDALSRVVYLITTMSVKVVGLEKIKEYRTCKDFSTIYTDLLAGQQVDYPNFSLQDGYLFNSHWLCLPSTSIHDQVLLVLHGRGYFGRDKIGAMVEERFYWPNLKHDATKFVSQ